MSPSMRLRQYGADKITATKAAFSSKEAFVSAIRVPPSAGFASTTTADGRPAKFTWSNEHLDPSPPSERTWSWVHFAALWAAYGFSVELWSIASSMIAAGLTWYQSLICVFISHLLGAIGVVLNGRGGSAYHFGFPVYQRASYGMFGSFIPILMRSIIGVVWVGVQIYQGGRFIQLCLRCIFGEAFSSLPNTIPVSAGITTQAMIGTILYWVCTMPLLHVKIHETRYFWTSKIIVMPFSIIGIFIYCVMQNGGKATGTFVGQEYSTGAKLGWAMVSIINSTMGKTSMACVNSPDLQRFSKTTKSPFWSQLISIPLANTLVAAFGVFGTSALQQAWNMDKENTIWNLWDLSDAILDRHWAPATRFAIFLASTTFVYSIFVVNASFNSMPFGADMSALLPKWLNINRGQVLGYCIGLLIQPWYILQSAGTFISFLGGYSIFLGGYLGISVADYYYRRGNLDVRGLYHDAQSPYWYTWGFNVRAIAAYLIGAVPPIPGFLATFGYSMPEGAVHLYSIGWLFATFTSATVYLVLVHFFPPAGIAEARAAPFEQFVHDQAALLDRTETFDGKPGAQTPSVASSEEKKGTFGTEAIVTVV